MFVCYVKHNEDGKEFLFECTGLERYIRHNTPVICDTMRGQSTGRAITQPIEIKSDGDSLRTLFQNTGAYMPLKRIVGIQMELSEADKEKIVREWINETLNQPEEDKLPFF